MRDESNPFAEDVRSGKIKHIFNNSIPKNIFNGVRTKGHDTAHPGWSTTAPYG